MFEIPGVGVNDPVVDDSADINGDYTNVSPLLLGDVSVDDIKELQILYNTMWEDAKAILATQPKNKEFRLKAEILQNHVSICNGTLALMK